MACKPYVKGFEIESLVKIYFPSDALTITDIESYINDSGLPYWDLDHRDGLVEMVFPLRSLEDINKFISLLMEIDPFFVIDYFMVTVFLRISISKEIRELIVSARDKFLELTKQVVEDLGMECKCSDLEQGVYRCSLFEVRFSDPRTVAVRSGITVTLISRRQERSTFVDVVYVVDKMLHSCMRLLHSFNLRLDEFVATLSQPSLS